MPAGSIALWLIVVTATALHSLIAFSHGRSLENEYNLDYPKRISGSKMWCYRRQLTLQTETIQLRECAKYPCLEGACRNCSYRTAERKRRVYTRVTQALQQPLASEYQNISSPGYPANYPSNVECVWLFKVPGRRRRRLTVEFHDLDLAGHHGDDCADNVRVRFISRRKNPTKRSKSAKFARKIFETKMCGSSVSNRYKNTRLAHVVEVVFTADSIHSSKGFSAIFRGFKATTDLDIHRKVKPGGGPLGDEKDVISSAIVCSKNSSLQIPLGIQKVMARVKATSAVENESDYQTSLSTFVRVNTTTVRYTVNYSLLVNATKMYEKYTNMKGRCDIKDKILDAMIKKVQTVRWPAELWDDVTPSSIIQDEKEEHMTTAASPITTESTGIHNPVNR
jgi:hypothetical protein